MKNIVYIFLFLPLFGMGQGIIDLNKVRIINASNQAFPEIEFYAPASNGPESQATRSVQVNLSETSLVDITVDYVVDALSTATGGGVDHSTANGQLVITAGNISGNIDIIGVVDDAIPENTNPDETIVLTLTNPVNAILGVNSTFTYYINDNDSPPVLNFTSTESNGLESIASADLEVGLSTTTGLDVTFDYSVTGGSATNGGTDFDMANGTGTITNGNLTTNITISQIVQDLLDEGNETVDVTISNPTNATLGNDLVHTYTIIDDDGALTIAFTSATSSGPESSGTADLELSLSATNGTDVTVDYSVTGGNATGGGTDYTLSSGTATITSGNLTTNINIPFINDDSLDESNETIEVTISSPSGAVLGTISVHTYTINDNDTSDTFVACTAGGGSQYNPTSSADIENPSNAGRTAVITNSFDCTNCTFASGQTIIPSGGTITGTNINLNGACIIDDFSQVFSTSTTFSEVYVASRISPEAFGATANDSGDDTASLNALIRQCAYAIGSPNGSYIKNSPTNYSRSGTFNWDMNGAKVEVTSTSNYRMAQVSVDAVFDFTNLSPTIFNGEFDGNDIYGRFFYLHGQDHFVFNNLWVHDLYSPNAIRAVAFRFSINADASGFSSGEFKDNLIEDVVAQGDGNYNDAGGIAKAWWYTLSGMSSSTTFNVVYENNVVRNIIGDDAEGFYAIGGASVSHNGSFSFDNEDYRYCTRRAMKLCVSNVEIQNSYFEEIPESMFNAAQQMGSMIDFFSTSSGNLIENIRVHDNTIRTVPGNNAHYYLLAVTDAKDVIIEDNIFTTENLHTYGTIRLGSNTATYSGDLQDIIIQNNTLNNGYVQAMLYYDPINAIDVNTNTFNFTSTLGYQVGAFRFYGSGTKGNVDFVDNDININMGSASGVNGVISSDSQVTGVVDFNIDNATVTISNAVPVRSFGYLQSNFNNTNTIQNSTIIGDVGTGAVDVTGTGGVVIIESYGDGPSAITED
nr:Calx-beta domain-containing protein [uncultured Allomuricauda sp.]